MLSSAVNFQAAIQTFGIYEIMPIRRASTFNQILCFGWLRSLCDRILEIIVGFKSPEFDQVSCILCHTIHLFSLLFFLLNTTSKYQVIIGRS